MPHSGLQFRRLLFIDQELQKGECPNCRSLAETWEVSTKTIQRDIDYLRDQLGAPIAYDASRHGYTYTEPSFRLPSLNISESDLFAVCIAEKALRQFENTPLHSKLADVFERIASSLPRSTQVNPDWVHERILFFEAPATRIQQDVWETLASAIRTNCRVRIAHAGPNESGSSVRTVEPYYLVNFRNAWYLSSYCCMRSDIRTFAVSRIQSADLLSETFKIPDDMDAATLFGDHFGIRWNTEWHTVRIRFNNHAAPYIRERKWHPQQILRSHRDGSLTLTFKTNHLSEVKDWILSWGENARALSPPALVKALRASLSASRRNYR